MEREQAIDAAIRHWQGRYHHPGGLRFVRYSWDHVSGWELHRGHFTRQVVGIPSLGELTRVFDRSEPRTRYHRLVHGWVVVFDPTDREPEWPEDCYSTWVPESGGGVRGRAPRSLGWEIALPLTGIRYVRNDR